MRAEGWKWIAVAPDFPYGHTAGLRRLAGETVDLTEEEQASFAALQAEYEALEEQYAEADELPDEVDQRLGEIETAHRGFREPARPLRSGRDRPRRRLRQHRQRGRAAHRARLRPPRGRSAGRAGHRRRKRRAARSPRCRAAPVQRTVITIGGAPTDSEPDTSEEDDAIRPLSDRLVTELTAHRTLALRDALANEPNVAFQAVLHALCLYGLLSLCLQHLPGDHGEELRLQRAGAGPGGDRLGQGDRGAARPMGQADCRRSRPISGTR